MVKAVITLQFTMEVEATQTFYQELCTFLADKNEVQVAQLASGIQFE